MTKLMIISMIGCLLFLLFVTLIVYGIVILTYRKEKLDKNMPVLDQYTTDYYRDELDEIIQNKAVYNVDYRVGKLFNSTHSITTDIPNDEIIAICDETIEEILNIIPPKMYLYLEKVMGIEWMKDYVKTQTISYVLNYSKLTIESLTIDKFGKERK